MNARVHSIETLGTVDGPGIRFVIFLQGCPLRCLYCHNPDTWDPHQGKEMSVASLLTAYEKNKMYYKQGGITVTGGEPLMQIDFLIELFSEAHRRGIHTCVDTSGIVYSSHGEMAKKIDQLMAETDLVLLDIKHIDPQKHQVLTGSTNTAVLNFARYLSEKDIPVWIRHVLVPEYTDHAEDLFQLGYFLGELSNIKALDILPYHTMGVDKYAELGLTYPIQDISEPREEAVEWSKKIVLQGIRQRLRERKSPLGMSC